MDAADRHAAQEAGASGSRRSASATATGTADGDGYEDTGDADEEDDDDDDEEVEILGEEKFKKKKFRKKSTAPCWNFFEKTDLLNVNGTRLARCKVEGCGKLVTCSNTTNLTKHVQRNHRELWYLDVKSGKKVLLLFDA